LAKRGSFLPNTSEYLDITIHRDLEREIKMTIATINPPQLAELCKSGKIDLIDVRTPVEFRELHIEQARNVPLDRVDPAAVAQARNGDKDKPLYLICRSGSRGRQACEKFLSAGYTNVVNIEGGTLACVEAGLPIVRGKKAISLERQVRIAAGSLVLVGVMLGWLVHPALYGLSAFIGAGLVFAGITDTCGMGMMLARMPWNQVKDASADHCATKEVCS
jgi:rhodanese-related sulfurtransferase